MNIKTGDAGQRYEVRCTHGDDTDYVVGWTDDPSGGEHAAMVEKNPSMHTPRVIDRDPRPARKLGEAE